MMPKSCLMPYRLLEPYNFKDAGRKLLILLYKIVPAHRYRLSKTGKNVKAGF